MFKYHYLYKITRTDGAYYIGVHSTNDLDDGYFGSGRKLKKSIQQYGIEQHTLDIVDFFNDRDSLYEAEKVAVNLNTLADPNCLNLKPGGSGGLAPVVLTPEFRQRLSEATKAVWSDPSMLMKRANIMREYWKTTQSNRRRETLSDRMTAQWSDSNYRQHRLDELATYARTAEARLHMSAVLSEKWKDPAFREHRSAMAAKKAWVHKDGVNHKVDKTEVEQLLLQGYARGRLKT